jgi:AcrR family transcriptional regulator
MAVKAKAKSAEKTVPQVQLESRTKGERTRDRLLDLTYLSVIRKGFAATSIEELVEEAGITKSGFFYHFKDKQDLARQMIERYADSNVSFIDTLAARARELHDDPLHSFLIFLKLYAEDMNEQVDQHPGCMVAMVTYQDLSFDQKTRDLTFDMVRNWRAKFLTWLHEIALAYPTRKPVDVDAMADTILALTYGGMTLSKAMGDVSVIGRQVLMFRETVRLTFQES